MDKLNKLSALCIAMTILIAGCGKKKETIDTSCTRKNSLMTANSMPLLADDADNLLEDDAFAEFAFVDDEPIAADMEEKSNNVPLLADNNNDEIDFDIDLDDEVGIVDEDPAATFAFQSVKFDFNKNSIRADQKTVVAQDIEIAQQAVDQGKQVVIEGHSCQIGSAGYNVALSQRRAEAVKTELVKNGVDKEKIKTLGYGYERPLVWSDAQDRNQLLKELSPNRRAEILVN